MATKVYQQGKYLGSADMEFRMFGAAIPGVEAIEMTVNQPSENQYGLGSVNPDGFAVGQKQYTISFTVKHKTLRQLGKLTKTKMVVDLPGTTLTATAKTGEVLITAEVRHFQDDGFSLSSGDTSGSVQVNCTGVIRFDDAALADVLQ